MADQSKLLAGTILGVVEEILQKGEFPCPIEDKVDSEKEVVISEVADYEKAILSAHSNITDRHNQEVVEAEKKQEEIDDLQARIDKKDCEILNNLFWSSIYRRLGKRAIETPLGIRNGWEIVSFEKEDDKPSFCIHCLEIHL